MLITLADELDTSVSVLLGETVMEPMTDDLKAISEKLEVINLQLAKRNMFKVKTIRWILITLCAFIVLAFIAFAVMTGAVHTFWEIAIQNVGTRSWEKTKMQHLDWNRVEKPCS